MTEHVFVGFGFGPIQAGLFVKEAFDSGNFSRIAVAEIDAELVEAVRANNGSYFVNVAKSDGLEVIKIDDIEIYNPNEQKDRGILLDALSHSTEIVTSLPSIESYDNIDAGVASLLAKGLENSSSPATIVYAAENNNYAAQILEEKVNSKTTEPIEHHVQYLNTVIGKMSQVVTETEEIQRKKLTPVAPGIKRAFLVEEFSKILVTKCEIKDFKPAIEVFIEKKDLLPFEEAKLYGHNAIHALLAYLGAYKGYTTMEELREDKKIMRIARDAFINESGASLIKKHSQVNDVLFTESGYLAYAEDLLERMMNPHLGDTIERAGRDIKRKLGLQDRIFGTMRLALEGGIEPANMALGAAAGIIALLKEPQEVSNLPKHLSYETFGKPGREQLKEILELVWNGDSTKYRDRLIALTENAFTRLKDFA
jgi:mannitol-1-phosphate 5-dehydrogenase